MTTTASTLAEKRRTRTTRTPGRDDAHYVKRRSTTRSAVITTTYPDSDDATRHRRDYRPEWLDNLADDATIEQSVLPGMLRDPRRSGDPQLCADAVRLHEFNYLSPYGDDGFVEDGRWCAVNRSAAW